MCDNYKSLNKSYVKLIDLNAEISTKLDNLLKRVPTGNSVPQPDNDCSSIIDSNVNSVLTFEFPLSTVNDAFKLNDALGKHKLRKELVEFVLLKVGRNDGEVDGH